MVTVGTFAVYVAVALSRHDNSILAAQAFTSLTLISLLSNPALIFIQAVPQVVQCIGCFDRLQEYCNRPSYEEAVGKPKTDSFDGDTSLKNSEKVTENMVKGENREPEENLLLISFHNQTVGWDQTAPPVLKRLDLNVRANEVTMIIGPIGSGKSTFLESILGETVVFEGKMAKYFSAAGYCPQTPWLRNQTVRQNIVGAFEFDEDWYATVVYACGLEQDLNQLPLGDSTVVGSNGLSLSGGQKQRIVRSSLNSFPLFQGHAKPLRIC